MNTPVKDKNILVTGGTTGIGRAIALALAEQGANLIIFGRHENELQQTLHVARKKGLQDKITGLIADVSKPEDVEHVFAIVDERWNQLDVVINNAALGYQGIEEGNYAEWEYIIKTNILGYLACAHEAIERMKKNKHGHIVNIGSMSADVREKDSSVYVATKSAIQGFSEALRKEVNEAGLKVSLIEPGAVGTDMQPVPAAEQRRKEAEGSMLKSEDIAACVLYVLSQPERCDVVEIKIRPHLQII